MSQNKQSVEDIKQTDQQQYRCFCAKKYSSYAGLYLHLKSKHQDAFSKYKNMKISKLLIPIENQTGKEIFRLKQPTKQKIQNKKKNSQILDNNPVQGKKQIQKQSVIPTPPNQYVFSYPNNSQIFPGMYPSFPINQYSVPQLQYNPNPINFYSTPSFVQQKFKPFDAYSYQNFENMMRINAINRNQPYDYTQPYPMNSMNSFTPNSNMQMYQNMVIMGPRSSFNNNNDMKINSYESQCIQKPKDNRKQQKIQSKKKSQQTQKQLKNAQLMTFSSNEDYLKKMYDSFINQHQSPTRTDSNNIPF